jgi:serine/threonine protein kinase
VRPDDGIEKQALIAVEFSQNHIIQGTMMAEISGKSGGQAPEHLDSETKAETETAPTASNEMPAPSSSPPPSGSEPMMIGDYRIIRKLGSGGMDVVYEAEQQHPKRLVALKVIKGGRFVDDQHIKLFEREA